MKFQIGYSDEEKAKLKEQSDLDAKHMLDLVTVEILQEIRKQYETEIVSQLLTGNHNYHTSDILRIKRIDELIAAKKGGE